MNYSEDKILKVIEALGEMLIKYEEKIKYQDYQVENLQKKIEAIEQYADYYSNKK